MNYKPDEAALIAYFYGEVNAGEREKIELYLEQNPDERKRLEEWSFTKEVMSGLGDKEVIAPPVFLADESNVRPIYRERYFRMTIGIAASLLVVLVAAKMLDFSASYSQGELRLGFGTKEKTIQEPVTPGLTEDKVNEMIQASLANNNDRIQASWNENKVMMEQAIKKNLVANSGKIDQFIKDAAETNREELVKFVAKVQNDNMDVMRDYMQLSSTGQKQYIESLLTDFNKYLQEQRKQDLQLFQVRMNSLEQNTDILKQETSEILASLINPGSAGNSKRN